MASCLCDFLFSANPCDFLFTQGFSEACGPIFSIGYFQKTMVGSGQTGISILFALFALLAVILSFFVFQYYAGRKTEKLLSQQKDELEHHIDVLSRTEKENAILALTVKNIQESIIITDLDQKVIFANDSFREHFGYSADDRRGINLESLLSPKNRTETLAAIKKHMLRGGWKGEIQGHKQNGEEFPALLSTAVNFNEKNQPESYIFIIQDISEHVQLEKKYRQSQKIEAIGRLASGVAHDFNNVLSIILGYSELAKKKLSKASIEIKEIDKIISAGNRATDLVKQILTFNRQSSYQLQPLHLHQVVQEALKFLRSSIPSSIVIIENIDEDCGEIMADPTNIYQVMMNLCMNAVHAMDPGTGTLIVNLHQVEVVNDEDKPRAYAKLSVQDTGIGMDEITMQKIFEPYFTTKDPGKGTGLGLSVLQGIVHDHDGFIQVQSELGKGSIFHVFLPLLELKTVKTSTLEIEQKLPVGTEHILVIDDEPEMVAIQKSRLEDLGYRVTGFTDSHLALKAFCAKPKDFDLILTDFSMPKLTGMELAQRAHIVAPNLPIMILTGFSHSFSKENARESGVKKILVKPISEKKLASSVRNIIDKGKTPQKSDK